MVFATTDNDLITPSTLSIIALTSDSLFFRQSTNGFPSNSLAERLIGQPIAKGIGVLKYKLILVARSVRFSDSALRECGQAGMYAKSGRG